MLLPALLAALAWTIFRVAVPDSHPLDWRAWFDGAERGLWRLETIDGEDVFADKFTISIADGRVTGGRDGCNYWSFADPDRPEAGRISTLALCEETPTRAAYRRIANGNPAMTLLSEDQLRFDRNGHDAIARRWTREDEAAERREEEQKMQALPRPENPVPSAPQTAIPPPPAPPPLAPAPPAIPEREQAR